MSDKSKRNKRLLERFSREYISSGYKVIDKTEDTMKLEKHTRMGYVIKCLSWILFPVGLILLLYPVKRKIVILRINKEGKVEIEHKKVKS